MRAKDMREGGITYGMKTVVWPWRNILIGLIILLGLALRAYNLDFPSIGYHNMKENEYLSMAEAMLGSDDFVTRRVYFYNAFEGDTTWRLYPQPPLISYQILLSWKMLGKNLWGPRLFNALFGAISILLIYLLARLLFKERRYAIFCAFLLAIMPLGVFFSRNLQPESPAFFFMLLGNLFYLKFVTSLNKYNLILGGASFSAALIYKFSFFIGMAPFVFCFPFKSLFKDKKEFLKCVFAFCLPYFIVMLAVAWLINTGQWKFEAAHTLNRIQLWEIFTPGYWEKSWRIIWWYTVGDNYTYIYTALALLGVIIAFFKRKGLLNRYIIGWAAAVIFYSMIFSDFINQHNYYQMPFLAFACVCCAYALSAVSEMLTIKRIPAHILTFGLMVFFAAVSAPFVKDSILRMHATVFWGLDVAGESLKEFTRPDERVFLFSHPQGQGIARYANRYMGWTDDLEAFKNKEAEFDIRYICFYPAEFALGLKAKNAALFEYIQNHYHTKEVGLTEGDSNLFYIILEKGKGSDPASFLQSFSGEKRLRTIYRLFGRYVFFYALRPSA